MLGRECWFCDQNGDREPLYFDWEYDTPVHLSCIKAALEKDPDHPEANAMTYLLEDNDAVNP